MLKLHAQNYHPRPVAGQKRKAFMEPNDGMEDSLPEERPAKRKVTFAKLPDALSFMQVDEPQDTIYTNTPTPDLYSPMEIDNPQHNFAYPATMMPETDESEGSDDELCNVMRHATISGDSGLLEALLDRPFAPLAKQQAESARSFSAITVGHESDNESCLSGDSIEC